MRERRNHWLTVQQTAALMDITSADVCRLLSLGHVSCSKKKQPRRPGKAQWLVDPHSIAQERRRVAQRVAKTRPAN